MNLPQDEASNSKPRIAIIAAIPFTIRSFLSQQIIALAKEYSVVVMSSEVNVELLDFLPDNVIFEPIPIKREIRYKSDLKTLLVLYRLFRKYRFHIVHTVTPKAGLLGMTAARLAGVKNRLHTFTGQVWVTKQGFWRHFLKFMDKIIAFNATKVLVDSPSQRDFLVRERVISEKSSLVLGHGSISGVDLERFKPDAEKRRQVRQELDIPDSEVIILYLGRLNSEKGVIELAQAFSQLMDEGHKAYLVYVGPDEGMQPILEEILEDKLDHVRFLPYTREPERYMAASDIFSLPSYREGFGSAVIEAAACGIPSVVTRIYGLCDAVVQEETGVLCEPGNIESLVEAQRIYLVDQGKRIAAGSAACLRAQECFGQQFLTDEIVELYARLCRRYN